VKSLPLILGRLKSMTKGSTKFTTIPKVINILHRVTLPFMTIYVVANKNPAFDIPSIREYFVDLDYVLSVISDGPTKSFAFRRLKYLSSKFTMYTLLNEFQELADMKARIICLHSFISLRHSTSSEFLIGNKLRTLNTRILLFIFQLSEISTTFERLILMFITQAV
jgi:hypothetical protein